MTEAAKQNAFKSVLKTLKNNKVMTMIKGDGIYIRLAGSIQKDEAFSLEWVNVLPYHTEEKTKTAPVPTIPEL